MAGREIEAERTDWDGSGNLDQFSLGELGDEAVGSFGRAVVVDEEFIRHVEQAAEVFDHSWEAGCDFFVGDIVPT